MRKAVVARWIRWFPPPLSQNQAIKSLQHVAIRSSEVTMRSAWLQVAASVHVMLGDSKR
jgi:hypothetical protein